MRRGTRVDAPPIRQSVAVQIKGAPAATHVRSSTATISFWTLWLASATCDDGVRATGKVLLARGWRVPAVSRVVGGTLPRPPERPRTVELAWIAEHADELAVGGYLPGPVRPPALLGPVTTSGYGDRLRMRLVAEQLPETSLRADNHGPPPRRPGLQASCRARGSVAVDLVRRDAPASSFRPCLSCGLRSLAWQGGLAGRGQLCPTASAVSARNRLIANRSESENRPR